MIPQTFEEWRNCIVNDCKINLTQQFAQQRLTIYQDANHPETKKFKSLYGQEHLDRVIHWLQRI
ncbi:MAG: hypothetical protein ACFB10_21375 [Salibacteraceae bacterium]